MAGLTKLEEQVQSLKSRLSNLREKTTSTAARIQRVGTSAVGAYVYGKFEADAAASGQTMSTIAGIDPMLTWGVGAALASDYIGGRWGEVLGDAGVGIVSAWAYKQASGR